MYNQFWISPEVRRYIVHESRTRFASGKLSKHERYELTGYAQRGRAFSGPGTVAGASA